MAVALKAAPSATNALQQRVTALDRSGDVFSLLIVEAFNLVDLDIETVSTHYNHVDAEEEARHDFGPKEEWVLRWLLKRFGEEIVGSASPCLEPKAWILLRIVASRLPSTVIARLLSTQNFIGILEKILQWLFVQAQFMISSGFISKIPLSPQRPLSRESSSSTTVQEGLSTNVKKSKKRKLEHTGSSTHQPDTPKGLDIHALLFSICSAVKQLETRTVETSSSPDDFGAEHMKAALKANVDQCSKVLGGFFGGLHVVLGAVLDGTLNEEDSKTADIYESLVLPMLELWSLRASSSDDFPGLISARAFSANCLLPATRLLALIQNHHAHIAEGAKLSDAIETLLTLHVILPARNAFLHGKRTVMKNEDLPTNVAQELLNPLAEAISVELRASTLQIKHSSFVGAIPWLFSVAIQRSGLNTPKQRIAEGPWLQALFMQLVRCAISNFPVSQPIVQDDRYLDVVEDMLRLAVERKIVLDVSILESTVLFLSGIEGVVSSSRVKWNLISLCLEIDPNLAIASPYKHQINESNAKLNSNILDSILVKLTSLGFRDVDYRSSDYDVMLYGVTLPLLRTCIRLRNLPGFIHIWRQQIVVWESTKASCVDKKAFSKYATCIWEDDVLLQTVSEKLELTLTEGQILRILRQFPTDTLSSGDHDPAKVAGMTADLVIFDCFVNGINIEGKTPALRSQLMLLLQSLLAAKEDASSQLSSWRVWRILATAWEHWSSSDLGSPPSTSLLERNIRAQKQLSDCMTDAPNGLKTLATFTRALFAFRFQVASSHVFRHKEQDAILPLLSSIQAIIDGMKRYADSIWGKVDDGVDGSALFVSWDGQRGSLKAKSTLTLACVAQLVLAPRDISCFDPELLDSFLEELFRCASLQAFPQYHSPIQGHQITYRCLWEELISSGGVREYKPLADSVRETLVKKFLGGELQEESARRKNDREQLALSGLYKVPFDAMRAQERNLIFQHASWRILGGGLAVYCTNYLTLLECCMPYIKKSTDLFSDPLYLWKIAQALDSGLCKPTPDTALTFRRFVSKALKLVIKRCIDFQTVEFLETFFATLHQHIISSSQSTSYFDLVLASVSLGKIYSCWHELPTPFQVEKYPLVETMRLFNLDSLLSYLSESDPGSTAMTCCWTPLFESLVGNIDLLKAGSRVRAEPAVLESLGRRLATLNSLVESVRRTAEKGDVSSAVESIASWGVYDNLVIAEKICSSLRNDDQNGNGTWVLIELENTQKFRNPRAMQSWLQFVVEEHHKLDLKGQVETLAGLGKCIRTGTLNDIELIYLRKILDHSHGTEAKMSNMKSALAQLFSVLCENLVHCASPRIGILTMHCLDLLMTKNAWSISQWQVDSLLSTISTVTSLSGPQTGSGSSDIFTCLTRLFGTLLTVHRSKLGGRYHLVVLALQGMLHCLFTPYTSNTDNSHHLQRPPWLKNTELGAEHTTAYARLLSSLCDPTVSAVTRSKNRARQELNDETKKAESIAGQHFQYVVIDFCQCQLHGRIDPEVRKALNPGLYAIFDAMSQEVMRTVNSALDAPGRAIFKMVYDDYRRFGRWQGA